MDHGAMGFLEAKLCQENKLVILNVITNLKNKLIFSYVFFIFSSNHLSHKNKVGHTFM